MPPCAATVCERVGKTLDNTAVFSPALESCSAARRPAPPPPTITASNLRMGKLICMFLYQITLNEYTAHMTNQTMVAQCRVSLKPKGLI